MRKLTDEQAVQLIAWGATKVSRFSDVLEEADDMRQLSNKQMVVVATAYAASLAKATQLDLEEFLRFTTLAYQHLEAKLHPEEEKPHG